MIVFDKVTKQFGDTKALDEVNLVIEPGEFVFLVGPSGAGKTTLARLLIKELDPTEGSVQVGEFELSQMRGRDIPILRRQIGMIFQDFKLLPERTAAENIALSLEIMGKSSRSILATVNELLEVTGLEGKGGLFPSQLSGGETQRVVIARAMATEPAVLFADEPTGNLDDDTAWNIVELLDRINKSGTAVIMSTHNKAFVKKLKRRIISLREGKIDHDTNPIKIIDDSKDNDKTTDPKPKNSESTDSPEKTDSSNKSKSKPSSKE